MPAIPDWFVRGLGAAFVVTVSTFLFAYLMAKVNPQQRRGKYASFVRDPKHRTNLYRPVMRPLQEAPCQYGAHMVPAHTLTKDDPTICERCASLRARTIESFMPEGIA